MLGKMFKKCLLIFMLFSCLTSCLYYSTNDHIIAGMEAYKEGDLEDAKEHFESAIKKDGGNVEAHNNLATVYLREGNLSDAVFELEKVIKLNPQYPEGHYNMGVAYAELGMWQESYEEFETTMSLVPKVRGMSTYKAELYYYMGTCMDQMGEWERAAPLLEKALLFNPRDNDSKRRLAYVYYYLGEYTQSQGQVKSLEASGVQIEAIFKKKLLEYLDWQDKKYLVEDGTISRRKRKTTRENKQGIRVE